MEKQPTPTASGEIGSRIGVRVYRYRAILRRYWWVLAITVGLGLVYEGWVLFTKPERFVSVGKLLVSETGGDQNSRNLAMDPSWYGTICATIKSPVVLERANKELSNERPEFGGMAGTVDISAENEPGNYIFDITGTGKKPEYTQVFVEAVISAFRNMRREEGADTARLRLDHLEHNLRDEQKAAADARKQMIEFQEQTNQPFIQDERERLSNELAEVKKDRESIQQEINTGQSLGKRNADSDGNGKNGGKQNTGNELLRLKTQIGSAKAELEARSKVWRPQHPRYVLMQKDIARMESELKIVEQEATHDRTAQAAVLQAELQTKTEAITELELKAKEFGKIAERFNFFKGELDRAEAQVKATRELYDKESADSGAATEILTVHQHAMPAVPEERNVLRNILTGLLGGLIIGLVVLFLLDRADDRLASSSEMIEQFAEPILGQIPDVADSRTDLGLPLLQPDDDRFMFTEAFRSLRSSLIFMPNQVQLKTLIVTSAIPNEGKSTVASNLAITMANAGARVLLVDADLRRGDIAALFDTDGRQGLANVLRGEVPWKSAVHSVRNGLLHILPRGPVTNQSGELLLLPALAKHLEEWKAAYDLVIFNTAPILATDDTPTLAPNFDGTLMVIRASFTSARLTRNSLNALYQRQVNVLGLILNCVDTELPDYYYYRYPKYYAA